MRLLLLRHLPVQLPPGICYGASDVAARPPTPTELAALRAAIGAAPTRVISSPLRRCEALATTLVLGAPVVRDDRLKEINFGDWELRAWDDIERAQIDAWAASPWGYRMPGGECANDLRNRVLAALDDALQQANQASVVQMLIVTHGGPLRVLRGHLLGLPQAQWLDGSCPPGGLLALARTADGRWQVAPDQP